MEKTTLGALGAISSLVALPGFAAVVTTRVEPAVPPARSFAELLDPIPNAVERLKIADEQDSMAQPRLIKAQYYLHHHHHHHHAYVIVRHYRHYYRPRYYRYRYVPPVVPYLLLQRHHHHHHHHHNHF
jgi:hypothetical protein